VLAAMLSLPEPPVVGTVPRLPVFQLALLLVYFTQKASPGLIWVSVLAKPGTPGA